MKKIRSIITLMLLAAHAAASPSPSPSPSLPADTAFHYGGRRVVISENDGELNVSVYRDDEQGDAVMSQKIYEGIFTGEKSVERVYENRFEISVPDIIKPKSKRRPSRSHLSGFGVGFVNLPEKFNFDGELASIIDLSRSLQYNLIPFEASWRMGNSNFTGIAGMGIQFNSIHWQNNKAIEVRDYKSVVTTAEAGYEYRRSRLHYTCLTFPFLIETNWNLQHGSHFFVNIGAVAKVKTASSSRIWWSDGEGRKQKTKFPGELNIRPVTLDLQIQAGIDDFGLFAAWSPFSLFRNGKGPAANQTTLGLQYYF